MHLLLRSRQIALIAIMALIPAIDPENAISAAAAHLPIKTLAASMASSGCRDRLAQVSSPEGLALLLRLLLPAAQPSLRMQLTAALRGYDGPLDGSARNRTESMGSSKL